MAKYIIILLAFLAAYLDYKAYCKLIKENVRIIFRRLFVWVISLSYASLFLSPFFMFFIRNENNNSLMMIVSMIILTLYIIFSVTRIFFYIFWLPTKRKIWRHIGLVLASLVLLNFIYGIFVTRTDYEVKEIEVAFDNLPESFNGYKIAFISDIHIGSMLNVESELKKVVEIINNTDSDVLLFGGDMVNIYSNELKSEILNIFSSVKCRDGVFSVLGNHDTGAYAKNATPAFQELSRCNLSDALKSAGWVMLRDSTVYIKRDNDSIAITGIDYSDELLKHKHSLSVINNLNISGIYKNVPSEIFNITISHLPQLWNLLYKDGYSDLTLSGHIHAMQIKYFSLSPAMFMYDNWSGLYENEQGKLYINDGIGSVAFLARFGARPEVTVITLKKEQ